MRKIVTALVAAASIGAAAMATSSTAEARWGSLGLGPGAIAGGVLSLGHSSGAHYAASPYYYPTATTATLIPYYGPGCGRVWNGYAWARACF